MTVEYIFHGDLQNLLRRKWRRAHPVVQEITRAASVKDVIESFGLPHTEVGRIECHGSPVDFSFPVTDNLKFDIRPVQTPFYVTKPTRLRPQSLDAIRFIVDANVGRLARYLRMAGFDTLYNTGWDKDEIIRVLSVQNRVVLTRDFDLLKRKKVEYGRYVRESRPAGQFHEVLQFFGISHQVASFRRCLECNSLLKTVEKTVIRDRLEPLTDKYYQSFSICPCCDKLYWAGSHIENMRRTFPELR